MRTTKDVSVQMLAYMESRDLPLTAMIVHDYAYSPNLPDTIVVAVVAKDAWKKNLE